MPERVGTVMERASLPYANLSQKFMRDLSNFSKQYSGIYLIRLKTMTGLLQKEAEKKWKNKYPSIKLHQLSAQDSTKCVVIGTLFKDQKLKPSILKQMAKGNQLLPQPIAQSFTDQSDKLYLEDDLQRYLLLGDIPGEDLVTGISCALLGTGDDKGRFQVDDFIFAGLREQIERPLLESPIYVLFLSGLNVLESADCYNYLEILMYWLQNMLHSNGSQIARLIIAGNVIRTVVEQSEPTISILSRKKEATSTFDAVKVIDDFLLQLSRIIDFDVMPGEHDPSNNILPQQPMHHCMFPKSAVLKTMNQVSNPYSCSLGGVNILGTSGQPVHDIMRYSAVSDPLDVLENCLKWGHVSPTSPDTLGCLPFYDEDPFIIGECPHVFFAGNQQEFGTRLVKGAERQTVRLISIPEFSSTFQVCLLDLKTLDCEPYTLGHT